MYLTVKQTVEQEAQSFFQRPNESEDQVVTRFLALIKSFTQGKPQAEVQRIRVSFLPALMNRCYSFSSDLRRDIRKWEEKTQRPNPKMGIEGSDLFRQVLYWLNQRKIFREQKGSGREREVPRNQPGPAKALKECRDFNSAQGCQRKNCKFTHKSKLGPNLKDAKVGKMNVCFYFSKGTCRRGANCKFLHESKEQKTSSS